MKDGYEYQEMGWRKRSLEWYILKMVPQAKEQRKLLEAKKVKETDSHL